MKTTVISGNARARIPRSPRVQKHAENTGQQALTGYDRSYLDPSVKPGDDFFRYAVGGLLKRVDIPPDRASWGMFEMIQEENMKKMKSILEEASANQTAPPGSNVRKLGDFYASGMDVSAIDRAGISPLAPEFQQIEKINNLKDLGVAIAGLHRIGINPCFGFGSMEDMQNPEMTIGDTSQGGLGLPDRDFYLAKDDRFVKIRGAYLDHMTRMFALLGDDPANARSEASKVMALETRLAEASMPRAEMRDPHKIYHVYGRKELAALTPNFSWDDYLSVRGRPDADKVNVETPEFFKSLDKALTAVPLDDWKAYLRWNLINGTSSFLSAPFEREHFDFYSHILSGVEQMPPRWKKMVRCADAYIGEALGQEFVRRYFPPESKEEALKLIDAEKSVLREKIIRSPWKEETKLEALAKANSLKVKIGYPDKWTDYSSLKIDGKDPFVVNILRAGQFAIDRDMARIGKPTDHSRWDMTPQTVNAYYNPLGNEFVAPAGIMQPPRFDKNADPAMNYGAFGNDPSHEMMHGFDDEGSQFDSKGQLRDWRAPEDKALAEKEAEGIKKQFGELEFKGSHVDGEAVCGEAMADLGGLQISWAAYKEVTKGMPDRVHDGFTRDQRFFLSYALSFLSKMRDEEAHRLIDQKNPHPLPEFRVNAILANFKPFREAFHLNRHDQMVRPEKVRNKLWEY